MRVAGKPYQPRTVLDARAHGVATAFQELSLVPTLSVAVNLFLPSPDTNRLGVVAMRRLEREAEALLAAHGISDIHPASLVGDLALGLRQRVEIVRALARRPRVLLLDEPTAALSDREWLFAQVATAVARGVAVLYISHKLDEVRRLCRRCVILRNGRKVLDSAVGDMSDDEIFSSMAGRSVVETFTSPPPAIRAGTPALRARTIRGPGVEDISFALAQGEVLGVAGLEGQGQSRFSSRWSACIRCIRERSRWRGFHGRCAPRNSRGGPNRAGAGGAQDRRHLQGSHHGRQRLLARDRPDHPIADHRPKGGATGGGACRAIRRSAGAIPAIWHRGALRRQPAKGGARPRPDDAGAVPAAVRPELAAWMSGPSKASTA